MDTSKAANAEAERRLLGRRSFRILERTAAALFPPGGVPAVGAADVELAAEVARILRGAPALLRAAVRIALLVWELAPLLSGRRHRFSNLPEAQRVAFAASSQRSRAPWRRLPLAALRPLCALAFASHPRVAADLGITEACLDDAPPRSGVQLHPIAHPEIAGDVALNADVVVVGSGAGGAVVAKELAERGLSVLVLEEGDHFQREDFCGPLHERVRRFYRNGGLSFAAGVPPIPVPLGKAVGGTTLVNSGTCFRAPESVLRGWASREGIEWLEPEALAPVYERVEDVLHVMPVPEALLGENARVFRRGIEKLGLHGEPIRRNIVGCRGCGVCAFGCPSDAKQAMQLSYLPRAEAAGARIYARCRVRRLRIEGGRARGVEAEILAAAGAGERRERVRGRLRVRAEAVVLAAGAVHTPLLLLGEGLARRGGPVGRGLRIHPAVGVTAVFDEEIRAWRGTLQSFVMDDYRESHGLLFEATSPVPGLSMASLRGEAGDAKAALAEYPNLASAGIFVADSSSGRVRRLPGGAPLLSYRLRRQDVQRLAFGIGVAARIFFAAGARRVLPGVWGAPALEHPRECEDWGQRPLAARSLSAVGFHPMASVRMGRDPARAGVDADGEVHGVRHLWVADASVLPDCAGVNPQLTIMAVATRIAWNIAARLGAPGEAA